MENGIKLEINRIKLENNWRKFEKYASIWKLSKTLLNNKEEITKEISKYSEVKKTKMQQIKVYGM